VSLPDPDPRDHPNRPGRALLVLAFVGILLAGGLGGAIGWGIVDTSCSEQPTVAGRLLETVPRFTAETRSCEVPLIAGALAGAAIAAVGAGVVAGLMLRAQTEWRAHPPGDPRGAGPVTPPGSGGNPPHT
jgi:hypothetical protein